MRLPLAPRSCPRFDACAAPVCPLDEGWRAAAHLRGEPVCYYLRASGKAGAKERFTGDPVFLACLAALPLVAAKHADVRRAVERAARSGMRGANLAAAGSDTGCSDTGAAAADSPEAA